MKMLVEELLTLEGGRYESVVAELAALREQLAARDVHIAALQSGLADATQLLAEAEDNWKGLHESWSAANDRANRLDRQHIAERDRADDLTAKLAAMERERDEAREAEGFVRADAERVTGNLRVKLTAAEARVAEARRLAFEEAADRVISLSKGTRNEAGAMALVEADSAIRALADRHSASPVAAGPGTQDPTARTKCDRNGCDKPAIVNTLGGHLCVAHFAEPITRGPGCPSGGVF